MSSGTPDRPDLASANSVDRLLGGLVTSFIGAVDNQDSPILVFNEQARRNVEGSFLLPDQVEAIGAVDGVAATAAIGEATYTVEAGGELVDGVLFGYPLDGDGLGAPTNGPMARATEAHWRLVGRGPANPTRVLLGQEPTFRLVTDDQSPGLPQDLVLDAHPLHPTR